MRFRKRDCQLRRWNSRPFATRERRKWARAGRP